MSTNPNNSVGTNGAFGGRTSVNAFNDVMTGLTRGVLSGWGCVPNSGLTVSIGGNGTTRDVAIAEDNAGNKTSINNISNSPINVTIGAAPGTNSRIDAIVAYVDNPPEGDATTTDNPAACGLIVVQGTSAVNPVAPNDSAIRTAITGDGASGTTAYYAILAYITMASGTTDITSGEISAGDPAQLGTAQIGNNTVTGDKVDFTTMKKWVPDYANGQVSSFNTAMPDDGFVFAYYSAFSSTASIDIYISVNNVNVAHDYQENITSGGTRVASTSAFVPVAAGDTLTYSASSTVTNRATTVVFYPGKWV